MTLIITDISRHGIVHASDSNVTRGDILVGRARKTFPILYLNAGLTLAGTAHVGDREFESWFEDFALDHQRRDIKSLGQFAEDLREALTRRMLPEQKRDGLLIHLAGYVESKSGGHHPEFWFIRNMTAIDPVTGGYVNPTDEFLISEDFWHRDYGKNNLEASFEKGVRQIYSNGFPAGRINYFILNDQLSQFFSGIWSHSDWSFRPPTRLEEIEMLQKLYVTIIGTLFEMSDYPAPYIGGGPQAFGIRNPDHG